MNKRRITRWKLQQLYATITSGKCHGYGLVSLTVAPEQDLARVRRMVREETNFVCNIKQRANRSSVLSALRATDRALGQFSTTPENGLIVFCGEVRNNEDRVEKCIQECVEPFRPVTIALFLIEQKFHADIVREMLEQEAIADSVLSSECKLTAKSPAIFSSTPIEELSQGVAKSTAQSSLLPIRLAIEKHLLQTLFDCLVTNSPLVVSGREATFRAFESSAVRSLLVSERLDIERITVSDGAKASVHYMNPRDADSFLARNRKLEVRERLPLADWLMRHAEEFPTEIELISESHLDGQRLAIEHEGVAGLLHPVT